MTVLPDEVASNLNDFIHRKRKGRLCIYKQFIVTTSQTLVKVVDKVAPIKINPNVDFIYEPEYHHFTDILYKIHAYDIEDAKNKYCTGLKEKYYKLASYECSDKTGPNYIIAAATSNINPQILTYMLEKNYCMVIQHLLKKEVSIW